MFGTLVICLPSKHEGGDVHVIHGAQRKTLGTAEFSEFNYTYLCWFVVILQTENSALTSKHSHVIMQQK
jgi:hypothetical protein